MYAEHWSDEKVFSNRATFNRDTQPAVLGVERVGEDDAGIYRCRVEFRVGQTRNSKVNLTVVGEYTFIETPFFPSPLELTHPIFLPGLNEVDMGGGDPSAIFSFAARFHFTSERSYPITREQRKKKKG